MKEEEYTLKGCIYAHSSGEFRIRERKGRAYELEFTDRPGLWLSTGKKDFDEAHEQAIACLHSSQRFLPNEKVLLNDLKDIFTETGEGSLQWRNERFGKHRERAYYNAHAGRLRNYILPKFGDWDIRRISDVAIESWYIDLTGIRSHKPLGAESKLKVLETFQLTMREAKRRGLIETNPCDTVQRIVPEKRKKKERRIFTQDEIDRLFPASNKRLMEIWGSLQWAVYFSIMLDTGFRPGEVLALGRTNFVKRADDNTYGIYSWASVNALTRDVREKIKTSEKGKGEKKGILSDYTDRLVAKYLKQMPSEQFYLFEVRGRFPYAGYTNDILRDACYEADVDCGERTQYCFRHTFDTHMLNCLGGEIQESDIQDLMAHMGYRPEYDHRTPLQIIEKLMKVKPAIDMMHRA